jgi:hypothetical protein
MQWGLPIFVDSAFWSTLGVVAVIVAAGTVLIRFGIVTREGVARSVRARRLRRRARLRDAALLCALAPDVRRAELRRCRRRAARQITVRRALGLPAALVAGWLVADEFDFLPRVASFVWAAAAAALLLWLSYRSVRREPLLLVGRVTGGIHGIEMTAAERPDMKGSLMAFAEKGSARTVTIEVRAACRIQRDGSLRADPSWRGEHEVGACRRLVKRGIENERCYLVCAGNGLVLGTLGDLVGRSAVRTTGPRPMPTAGDPS